MHYEEVAIRGILRDSMFVNISGYRFLDLPDRDSLRSPFREKCISLGLKGTILLSHNGINFFLAGTQEAIDGFISFLEEDPRLIGIPMHISHSDYQPFRRMLVRLKKEIISLGMDEIRPVEKEAKYIDPNEFKRWLDEGKEVVVLDTRNDYELRVGTFENAVDLDIKSFREFPDAVKRLDYDKSTPVVMFCTGGIRCEKASIVMEDQGWNEVYQIKGGVLGYFKETGGEHWQGDCFVFDQRVSLDKDLLESDHQMCFKCREPLSPDDLESERYSLEEYCPYCYERLVV
tara:strand:- start:9289 stop:10152 length:864 start_codon:yes stop_codon:yes gene_type:complete